MLSIQYRDSLRKSVLLLSANDFSLTCVNLWLQSIELYARSTLCIRSASTQVPILIGEFIMPMRLLFAALLFSSVFAAPGLAQPCTPPPIVANAKSANMFSAEQEMVIGELTVQRLSSEFRQMRDAVLLKYLEELGERLSRHLPPTGLKYTFHLIDYPEANAFNIPGGHVFVSRKLISFVNNEDELAGVIAHELGHATVHHGAADMSDSMRKILKITSLGDRRDVTEKYNLLIENARTKRISRKNDHENAQQLEADSIGIFAMVAAGYDASAFFSFFDRLTESEGKTGSWFSDLFGSMKPAEKRLREMSKATEKLPATCREGRSVKATENFLKWQADVVKFRETGRSEELPGLLWKKELSPKLRSDVSYIEFSSDGKLILAQDDYGITVIQREPALVLFQIPVTDALRANFTPDGADIVLTTENLRFERWSIGQKAPVESRELVLRRNCWEHELSPNGNFLACVDTSANINIIDTKTGKRVWEKKKFYELSIFEYISWLSKSSGDDPTGLFRIEFSPDSRFVMMSRSQKFRYRFRINDQVVGSSEDTALALDMTTLTQIKVDGDLKNIASRTYKFLDSGRILGMPSWKSEDSGIFSFPQGKRLEKLKFSASVISRTQNPDYFVIKPIQNLMLGVFDAKRAAIVAGMNKADMAVFGNYIAFESAAGKLVIREAKYNDATKSLDGKDVATIDLPASSIGTLRAASVSDSFEFMALSSKTRGGLWNLKTGERKVYVRGFRGAVVGEDGGSVGQFPKQAADEQSLVLLNAANAQVLPVRALPSRGVRQYGRFTLTRTPLNGEKKPAREDDKNGGPPDEEESETDLFREVKFELKNFITDTVVWSRDFAKDAPRYSFDEFSGRLVLYWRLGSETGKAKLKENAELRLKADALGNKENDYLLEIIDAFDKKTIGMMLVETGKGSFNVYSGLSEGNWLILYDSEDRVLAYTINDGVLRHRFFGNDAAINPKRNQIAVENFPGEINIYDLDSGESIAKMVINGKAAFVRFNLAGDKLFVLSDSQSAYSFDLNKSGTARKPIKF